MSFYDRILSGLGIKKTRDIPAEASNKVTAVKVKKTRKPKTPKTVPEIVTQPVAAEPKVDVKMDFDKQNPRIGNWELDWNPEFVELLRKHGYEGNNEEEIIEAWLNDICRTTLANMYPGSNVSNIESARYVRRTDLGDGKTEVS